jgi:hypothetical protein
VGVEWLLLADIPARKDAVIAVAGAAAALGGLVLVFLGVVIAGRAAYGGDTSAAILKPYRRAAAALLGVFALSLASVTLSVAWLATEGCAGALYEAALWTFFALLLAVLVAAAGTVYLVVLA